jgi:hypothetical protein
MPRSYRTSTAWTRVTGLVASSVAPSGSSATSSPWIAGASQVAGRSASDTRLHALGHLVDASAGCRHRDLEPRARPERGGPRREHGAHEGELAPDLGRVVIDVQRRSREEHRIVARQVVGRIAARIVVGRLDDVDRAPGRELPERRGIGLARALAGMLATRLALGGRLALCDQEMGQDMSR